MANEELDPRVKKFQTGLKVAGAAAVAVVGSGVVIVGSLSVMAAGALALGALAMVTFVIPVGARSLALARQKALTALAETFSEETIRDDEEAEAERVKILEQQYKISRAELEGAQEEMRNQLDGADTATQELINSQVAELQNVIDEGEATLQQRMFDLEELRKANKLYIAFQRAAAAMIKAQGAERTAAERQRIETARNAIKTRMRGAMAGKTIESMRSKAGVGGSDKLPLHKVAAIGSSRPVTIQPQTLKETSHVPRDR